MEEKKVSLMTIIKPIIRVNQLFGVCPHLISGDIMIFRLKSFRVLHTIFSLCVLILYFLFVLVQFGLSFSRERPMPEKVQLALWVGGTLVPIAMLIVTFRKRNNFTLFFEKMQDYKEPLKGMIKCEPVLAYSRKLYCLYIVLCTLSCIFVSSTIIRNPQGDISILAYWPEPPSNTLVALACVFQCYLAITKSCASAFIEVLCSSLATCFFHTIITIKDELQNDLGENPRSLRQRQQNSQRISPCNKEMANHPHVKKVNERKDMYPVIPSLDSDDHHKFHDNDHHHGFSLMKPYTTVNTSADGFESNYYLEPSGAGPILLAIKRFSCVSNMLRLINCIVGPLLALDSGFLVFMSCLLLYLQINYLGSEYVDKWEGIMFSGSSIIFFLRLIIIFTNLGSVQQVSICFNGMLTSSLMEIKKPKVMEVNLILAHLSTHSAHPLSFSAGGFFTFSKSSLLAVFSGIMTYVVFLLQAKNNFT